jgi:hypothetical protein
MIRSKRTVLRKISYNWLGFNLAMILRYASHFPKPTGLGPHDIINVIWFILFQIYQNLKNTGAYYNPSCIILLYLNNFFFVLIQKY